MRSPEFFVDGTTIPDVTFDIGPGWSGLLPISSDPNETRKVRRGPNCPRGVRDDHAGGLWSVGADDRVVLPPHAASVRLAFSLSIALLLVLPTRSAGKSG